MIRRKLLALLLLVPMFALYFTGCLGSSAGFDSSQHYSLNSIETVPGGANSSYVTYEVNFSITNVGNAPLQTQSRYIDDGLVLTAKDGSSFSTTAYWDGEWWKGNPEALEPGESVNYSGCFHILGNKVPSSLWFQGVTFARL